MTMEQEIRYRDAEPGGGGVSDPEVESVMKMLMAYRKARAEGVGQPNPELDVNPPPLSLRCECRSYH